MKCAEHAQAASQYFTDILVLQDAMQLAQEQQNELAGISHWYTSTIQCLQQQASSLCEQLKEALLPFTAQSHVSMQVLRWLQLFKTALRSSMSVGCK